ncbi:probable protein phosphatase 2C 18 [Andrographis paniculata]|uniref:probable protein phosphatase 2C 18 n=1 Tax=Andrographis paniculata TaxID=175694 RepID=UPI0021E801DD|nr:probable protein phosphatase 2C 18 [Andrographis paniculata]
MGICYSSNRKRKGEWEESGYGIGNPDFKLKSSSGDLAALISKLSGGGAAEERALHQIPGRLFSNGSSRIASLYTQQGKKGTNQDSMVVWENFCSEGFNSDATFCGVFDGHGPYGHMVSRRVRDALPILLRTQWESNPESDENENHGSVEGMKRFDDFMDEDGCESVEGDDGEGIPEIHIPLKKSFVKAFKLMDKELKLHPTIDCFCSGTTAVTLIKQGQDLIIGNIGDSRAILGTRGEDNSLEAVQLTVDLKPNLPREAARIHKCLGRVFALQDEPDVARVWLPNSDTPGLAMARAFGDFCLKDFGLISMPDVYHHHITERDEFVILATDGVWDVLSNKEAVDIVASAPGPGTAARALVDCATRAWRLKYPTSKNDDCAVVCLFLKHAGMHDAPRSRNNAANVSPEEETKRVPLETDSDEQAVDGIMRSGTTKESSEIVPVAEEVVDKEIGKALGQSKRSLAECISTADDEEWSALEGITRVNSLLSLPRFLPFDRRSLSWRKWL